jgi:hypothetical protein
LAFERVELVGRLVRFDFNFAEILPTLRRRECGTQGHCAEVQMTRTRFMIVISS